MMTSLCTWMLKKYLGFQFRKSAIKKLYTYNRVKKADESHPSDMEGDLSKSRGDITDSKSAFSGLSGLNKKRV